MYIARALWMRLGAHNLLKIMMAQQYIIIIISLLCQRRQLDGLSYNKIVRERGREVKEIMRNAQNI